MYDYYERDYQIASVSGDGKVCWTPGLQQRLQMQHRKGIGKKGGGTRATALCTSRTRLIMASFKPALRDWDVRTALANDTAVAGRNLLIHTMRRQVVMEADTIQLSIRFC